MQQPAIVQLNMSDYRSFIVALRAAFGVGAGFSAAGASTPDDRGNPEVEVHGNHWRYGYRRSDMYLTHGKLATQATYLRLPENYNEMGGLPQSVNHGAILNACVSGPTARGAHALIALITSEAARSQVIYQVVQQTYHRHRDIPYELLQPLLRMWGQYSVNQTERREPHRKSERYHHKSRPPAYGPLGMRDYYDDAQAQAAVAQLAKAGIQIDP
jgi:hypothetical protein